MLKRLIHAWEHSLSLRDINRKIRRFSWGIEHLLTDGSAQAIISQVALAGLRPTALGPTVSLLTDTREFLHQYCETAMRNSDAFFSAPRTDDYELVGDHLTFPSAIRSHYAPNNTVHARLFAVPSRGRAVIVLPQWNALSDGHVALCQLLNKAGLTALRLSLPYHDQRRPRHLRRAEPMVSPNIGLTIQANRQAVLDVRRATDWLEAQGYTSIGVMGTSIGSCIAFLAQAHDERLNVAVFNHGSSYFADVVWSGISTQHVRAGLERAVSLEELRKLWGILSPYHFVDRMCRRDQKSLIISGRYDLTFLPQLTDQIVAEFRRQNVPVHHRVLPCGHYTLGHFPFNYLDGFLITKFLRKHL